MKDVSLAIEAGEFFTLLNQEGRHRISRVLYDAVLVMLGEPHFMGKGYKGVPCVYCIEREAEDGDHVVARQFFLPEKRGDLPKVPACKICNNEKSRLEHRLTTVLPFGGEHADAGRTLNELVPSRLAKNNKLHMAVARGMKEYVVSSNGGPWEFGMTIPFDGQAMERLFEYIVRGLAWHHWNLLLGPGVFVRAGFLVETGRRGFEYLLSLGVRDRVSVSLGDGAFTYEGVQAKECPEFTAWRLSFYGGVMVGGDRNHPTERCTAAYGITAPLTWPALQKFREMLGGQSAIARCSMASC